MLWLQHGPAAVALIRPLVWELPYTAGVALKSKKKKKVETNPTRNHEVKGSITGLAQWVKDLALL